MSHSQKPTREQAEEAIRTLIRWGGDDPQRPGLIDTPKRVAKAYEEWFSGSELSVDEKSYKFFDDLNDYKELIIQKDISFFSTCEHHLAPIIGTAHIGYYPNKRIIGLSKFSRIIEIFARRLQMQERLTQQISEALFTILEPKGVIINISAEHLCMSSRGVKKHGVSTITQSAKGCFENNIELIDDFYSLLKK